MKAVLFSAALMFASMVGGGAFAMESKGVLACSADCNKAYWQCVRTDDGQKMSQRMQGCNAEVRACNKACRQS